MLLLLALDEAAKQADPVSADVLLEDKVKMLQGKLINLGLTKESLSVQALVGGGAKRPPWGGRDPDAGSFVGHCE